MPGFQAKKLSIVVAIAVAGLLVACGGGTTPAATPTEPAGQVGTAAPTPTTAPAAPTGPSGTLVVANDLVGPPVFLPSGLSGGAHTTFGLVDWGFFEYLIRADHSDPPVLGQAGTSGIASAWTVAPDGSRVTFTIREGVQFHEGWGEVTAHDVAFSFNESSKDGSLNPRGPAFLQWTDTWEAVDDRTAVMHIKPGQMAPDGLWELSYGNHGGGSVPIVSKRVFDERGEDYATRTAIGTGPFRVTQWTSGDEIRGVAVPDHYRGTPKLENLRIVQISEPASKIAAFRTGEVDMVSVPISFLQETQDAVAGAWLQQVGLDQSQQINFAGNYWAEVDQDGNDIYRAREGFTPGPSHPWIGDPDDPAQMEQARKFRWALAMAIDYELIQDTIFAGTGQITYTHTRFDVENPEHQPYHKDEWIIPFDVDTAKQYMAEAGVQPGFSFTIFVPPDNTAAVDPEVGEAIAQMWRSNLGLQVSIEKTAYAARRPTFVDRSINIPWQHHSGAGPIDSPKATGMVPSLGFGLGVEVPQEIQDLRWANNTEPDQAKRIQNNVEIQDYLTHWMLTINAGTMAGHWVVGPNVLEWTPYQQSWTMLVAPETVVMR